MTRRLSLAGQLLALQVVIICVVLVGVAAVTVAQTIQGSHESEGRRARAAGETLANAKATRDEFEDGGLRYLQIAARGTKSAFEADAVLIADGEHRVLASTDTEQIDTLFPVGDSPVLSGRSWSGDRLYEGRPAAVAMVPILALNGDTIGFVVVQRLYPSVGDALAGAAPNLLTYLGLASIIGIVGSLLVARRVKRQTLGMEPPEIAGLVEHRDAMLHGIREGVVGLDLRGRVTLINDEAIRLLRIPGDALGRTLDELGVGEDMRDALLTETVERDRPVASAGRVLVVNRLPIASRGRPIGSVTTLRDRTELLELRRELDLTKHVTDTLRAQAHEFSNRLHTIAGLIELGEADEAVRFVHRVSVGRSELTEAVTAAVRDPSIAALLIAKASQADELGVELRISPDASLPALDDELSTDVATVVGNLVDNALDAAATAPERWVEVALGVVDGEVDIVVRDSGPGVPRGMEREVFRRGMSTKAEAERSTCGGHAGERGIGLSLVHLVCTRRGGSVTATSVGGSTFAARLPVDPALVRS